MNTHITYTISNTTTGRQYFGRTDLARPRLSKKQTRWDEHKFYLEAGRHSNKFLQADFNQGFEFIYTVLQTKLTKAESVAAETAMILANVDCYNIRKTKRFMSRGCYDGSAKAGMPMLGWTVIQAIKSLKGKKRGYEIAQEFDISPSTVSNIFTGKYACNFKTVRFS